MLSRRLGSRECSMHFRVLPHGRPRMAIRRRLFIGLDFNDRRAQLGSRQQRVSPFIFPSADANTGEHGKNDRCATRTSGLKPLISRAPLTHFVKTGERCGLCGTRGEREREKGERTGNPAQERSCIAYGEVVRRSFRVLNRVQMIIARPLALELAFAYYANNQRCFPLSAKWPH